MSVDSAVLPTPATTDFASLDIAPALVRALARDGITTPTPVQAAFVPDALAGRDVLGKARTGSGKTLAFGLPIIARLAGGRSRSKAPRALIVVPTRELANQVRKVIEPLADIVRLRVATIYGGTPYDRQIKRLRAGVDIVIATPGRLDDLIRKGACTLEAVEIAVLDEADHLCDLGFYPAVDALLHQTMTGGQRMLLSATLDGDVDRLVRTHLAKPVRHEIGVEEEDESQMEHHVLVTAHTQKSQTAMTLLEANPRSIVFTRTRAGATDLARELSDAGVNAVDLHGDLNQRARERNLRKFSTGQATVVVATDVAARGIHVDNVSLVVHYDLPNEPKSYLHRSGRTARAGEAGAVVTLTTPRMVDEVVRLHKTVGIAARHHDIRTAPRPLTALALSTSGADAPEVSGRSTPKSGGRGGYRGQGRSSGGYQGKSPRSGGYRGQGGRSSYRPR